MGGVEPILEQKARALMTSLRGLLSAHPSFFTSSDIPERAGIYIIFDGDGGRPYYIGQSRNLRRRLLIDHRRGNGKSSIFRRKLASLKRLDDEPAVTLYILEKCSIRFLELESEWERLELEHFATAILSPLLNVRGG